MQLANFVTGLEVPVQIGVLVHVAIALVPNLLLVGFFTKRRSHLMPVLFYQ